MTGDLARLFRRDLTRLCQQIDAFPNVALLWQTLPGIANSAGNLALHLDGNLREYIGRQLGGLDYTRTREIEFSAKGIPKAELLAKLADLRQTVPAIVEGLTAERLAQEYPEVVLEVPLSTQDFIIHLYGHLGWHLGQVDYLRRALTGDGALARTRL